MTMMKQIPVLLMIILPLTSSKKNIYCEEKDDGVMNSDLFDVICKNTSIQANEVIGVRNNSQKGVFRVELASVSADLHNNTLQYLPTAHILEIRNSNISNFSLQSGIKILAVSDSIFPRVTSDVLKGCRNLTFVGFASNYGLQFDKGAFKYLKNLNSLTIVNQTLPKIRRSLFEGLHNLSELRLVSDSIQEIDEDAFMDLSNMEGISLDGNPIETFNVNISGLTKLHGLALFNTNLKRLNFDVLSNIYKIGLSRHLLRNVNATELVTKLPRLYAVFVLPGELECPEVIPVANKLEKLGMEVIRAQNVKYLEFTKSSVC